MPDRHDSQEPARLRVAFLGSGSSGNAAVLTDGSTAVLVDCGFSAREAARRLTSRGIDPARVSAILVTHEHTDHTCGIAAFARRFGCSVWATAGTRRAGQLDAHAEDVHTLVPGESTRIGTLDVVPFRTSHDAAEPVGYVVRDASGMSVGIATDTGVFTDEAAEALAECDEVGLECNHDPDMLATGPYPYFLKQRIASSRGHLANADAAIALQRIASERLARVHALHLSRTNNTHVLAREALQERLERLGLQSEVTSVTQDGASPV